MRSELQFPKGGVPRKVLSTSFRVSLNFVSVHMFFKSLGDFGSVTIFQPNQLHTIVVCIK